MPLVQNNTFIHNSTFGSGGGLLSLARRIIQNNAFIENQAGGEGGGICIYGNVTVQNNLFSGNTSTYYGGGLYIGEAESLRLSRTIRSTIIPPQMVVGFIFRIVAQ